MIHIFEYLTHFIISRDKASYCDDFVDRLNRKYTVIILLVFLTVISSKQYVGDPLACFCPAHFTGAHVEYTNNICWISRAYYVPIDTPFTRASSMAMFPSATNIDATPVGSSAAVPSPVVSSGILNAFATNGGFNTANEPPPSFASGSSSGAASFPASFASSLFASFNLNFNLNQEPTTLDSFQYPSKSNSSHMKFARVENLIAYYPFLLLAQAIIFYIPYFCWKNIVSRSAYDIGTLVYLARDSQYTDTDLQREKLLRYLIRHIDRANNYYSSLKNLKRQSKLPSASTTTSSASTPTPSATINPSIHIEPPSSSGMSSASLTASNLYRHNKQLGQKRHVSLQEKMEFDVINMESGNEEAARDNTKKRPIDMFKNLNLGGLFSHLACCMFKKQETPSKSSRYSEKEYHPHRHRSHSKETPRASFQRPSPSDSHDSKYFGKNLEAQTHVFNEKKNDMAEDASNTSMQQEPSAPLGYGNNDLYNYDENDFYDEDTGQVKAHNYIISNYLPSIQYFFYAKLMFTLYMIIKVIYILNCLCQFLIINKFIAGKSQSSLIYNHNTTMVRSDLTFLTQGNLWKGFEFGYRSVASFIESGSFFGDSSHLVVFHTVVFCDFRIRMLGDHLHRHTVQCVLPINIFSEKIFTMLWFWLFFLNIMNIYNFIGWVAYFFSFRVREDFIQKHVFMANPSKYKGTSMGRGEPLIYNSKKSPVPSGYPHQGIMKQATMQHYQYNPTQQKATTSYFKTTSFGVEKGSVDASPSPTPIYSLPPQQRLSQLRPHPSTSQTQLRSEINTKLVYNMTKYYLMHDNVFIIKLISLNTNEFVTRELVNLLLDNYKKKCQLYDDKTI